MNSINGIPGYLREAYAPSPLVPATEPERPKEGLHQSPERVPQVVDAAEAEQLAQRRTRVQRDNTEEELDTRTRRALQAYQVQAADPEKDYVSGLLGRDTYA